MDMKNFLPGRMELALFVTIAVFCGVIGQLSHHTDYALGLLGMPVFLVAALLGHRSRVSRVEQNAQEADDHEPVV
jgi:hypothetical protein